MCTKYIILKKNFAPIMFSEAVIHKDVAENFGGKFAVRSAGFFTLTVQPGGIILIVCFGGSTSLGGIKADCKVDADLIRKALHL